MSEPSDPTNEAGFDAPRTPYDDPPNPLEAVSLDKLRRRTSMKWRHYPEDVLPLWVAEMDVALAPPVVEAVSAAMAAGDTGYPVAEEYVAALADFAKHRWDWAFDTGHTSLVADVMTGATEVLRLVTDPGDIVVVNSPVYTPFYQFVGSAGRRVVESPLHPPGSAGPSYRLDLTHLERTFAEQRPAAYLLCSPHNPTGTVHTREELTAVGALAEQYGVRVVVDEIHAPLVHGEHAHLPYLSLPGGERGFALYSASKGWNLAGLKAAVAVAGPEAADDLARMPEEVGHGPSQAGVIGHRAALAHGREWLDALLRGLDHNRRLLGDLLAEHLPAVGYRMPEGTYLAWLDCRGLQVGADPAAVFLERGRVALSPGPAFGTGGEGHARLNLATSPAILTEAVRRMAAAL